MFQRILVLSFVSLFFFGAIAQEKSLRIEKTTFNSGFDDFGVRIFQDKIFVISTARDSVPVYDEKTGKPFTDIFVVANDLLIPAELMSEKYGKELLISSHFYDGPIAFNKDQSILFFSNNSDIALGDKMGIFYLKKNKNGAWSESIPFPFNSVSYSTMHPFYDDASQTLYFAANKTDGLGRFDVYSVPFDGTTFGEMKIIEGANSIMNETYPFVIENELYFSSDRSGGLGGLDIYKLSSDKMVTSIGEPFNTTFDDFDISFIDENNGFFSSNRQLMMNAATDDDCYFFHYSEPFTQVVQTINLLNDTTKNSELLRLSNDLLAVAKNNVYFNSANASISTTLSESINNTNEVAQIEKEFAAFVPEIFAAVDSVVFTNISFVSKRLAKEKAAKRLLTKIAQTNDLFFRANYLDSLANSDLIVESNSHLKNLVALAIAKNQALIQRINKNTELQDKLTNATQLLVAEAAKAHLKLDNPLLKEQLAAYLQANKIELAQQNIAENQYSTATIQQIADAYVSAPILFAFDSYELSQEYDTMLIEMAAFIKTNSAFQIFVDGHTDDSGLLAYNSKLSKRRALAVKRFLIKQGVKSTDFVVAYYGPEKPVATNDTREGRKLNRRVEIRLVPRK